jgi:hypothetical protein
MAAPCLGTDRETTLSSATAGTIRSARFDASETVTGTVILTVMAAATVREVADFIMGAGSTTASPVAAGTDGVSAGDQTVMAAVAADNHVLAGVILAVVIPAAIRVAAAVALAVATAVVDTGANEIS